MYGEEKELIPDDAQKPLGNYGRLTHYVDDNLYSMTNSLVVPLQVYFIWLIKLQWVCIIRRRRNVDIATYGSEFVSTRICLEHILNLRNTI